ncbi:MAG TPA: DNA polymerase III subunit beta [Anaerolineales bacterium]|nr:DNA polymerase III subunit beta [Anaerolineales bacterium]
MKVSCLQENLAKGLSIVGRAVSPRSTLPILSHVLLATDGGRLRLSATNLEIGINCWIGARVEEEGTIAVPARTFIDLVNALPPDRVDMEGVVRTMTLNLRCGRSEANIKGMDAVEFPPIPMPEGEGGVRLDAEALRTAIAQVAFAAATDEARPILTGVLVQFEEDRVTLAAADGYRLSVRSVPLPEPVGEPFSVIVPARAMVELGRICADQEEPVLTTVTPDHNRILFQLTDVVLVSQLIPGNFPDYRQIIPRDRNTRTVVGTADLLKACRTAQIFARDGAHIVQFHVHLGTDLEPGRLVVSATSAETGDDVTQLDASVEGEPIEIAFNVKYLIDVLSVLGTPQVALDTTSSSSPGVLRPVGEEDFIHVVMPMHLGR